MQEYEWTSVAVDFDNQYKRSNFTYNFGDEEQDLFFEFELTKDMDTVDLDLAVTVTQQGNRLGNYRAREKPFQPSSFSIVLISESGHWIGATQNDKFSTSLLVDDRVLQAGKYMALVSAAWNSASNYHSEYKQVFVEIISNQEITFRQVSFSNGMQIFT